MKWQGSQGLNPVNVRIQRINQMLRDELSELVLHKLKDPRLMGLLSITEVDTTPDFSHAQVYVSIMASLEEQTSALQGLTSAAGFLQRMLRRRLTLRRIPELRFVLDTSIQRGNELLNLIDTVNRPEPPPQEERP